MMSYLKDINLAEPPGIVRLLCAPDLDSEGDIYAIELDTHTEAVIDCQEASPFMGDCYSWRADAFDQGRSIQVNMSAYDWQQWLADYELVEPSDWVTLTCAAEDGGICALSLIDKQEAISPPDEVSQFIGGCHGWDAHCFDTGYSIVVRMAAEDWVSWLEMSEVEPPPIAADCI